MSDKNDEYRFYPEDFDDDGNRIEEESNPAPLVIVGSLGLGAGMLFASPFIDSVPLFGTEVDFAVIAASVFAIGLLIGGIAYARDGKPRLGAIHVLGALGWSSFVAGASISNAVVLVFGAAILVVSALSMITLAWR